MTEGLFGEVEEPNLTMVRVPRDIPLRSGWEGGTWVERGVYRVLRRLHNNRYLIVLKEVGRERVLTIVKTKEVRSV